MQEKFLGNFTDLINLVEEYFRVNKINGTVDEDADTFEEYEEKFDEIFKSSMDGLLEPRGTLLEEYHWYETFVDTEDMIKAFRKLLEKIIPNKGLFFGGNYPVLEPGKSDLLIKETLYTKIEANTAHGKV